MKKTLFSLLAALTLLVLPTLAHADNYDRDDSDHPLRLVAYILHPIGIAVEYAVLRPIHMLVEGPNSHIWFGHEPARPEDKDPMEWE